MTWSGEAYGSPSSVTARSSPKRLMKPMSQAKLTSDRPQSRRGFPAPAQTDVSGATPGPGVGATGNFCPRRPSPGWALRPSKAPAASTQVSVDVVWTAVRPG